MPLDLKRLRRDARRLAQPAKEDGAQPSGAMAIVRSHLPEIERLKAEGVSWVAIAAALAEQGVRQRDGRPITGRRLTGLIDSIRRQDEKRRAATARRASRADLAGEPPAGHGRRSSETAALSPPRATGGPPVEAGTPSPPSPGHRSAEQLRRDGLADLYDMLKGKKT